MSNAARADFNDGVIAYVMNDYEKAFTTMQSLAETSDHGYAQYYMGVMSVSYTHLTLPTILLV